MRYLSRLQTLEVDAVQLPKSQMGSPTKVNLNEVKEFLARHGKSDMSVTSTYFYIHVGALAYRTSDWLLWVDGEIVDLRDVDFQRLFKKLEEPSPEMKLPVNSGIDPYPHRQW